MPKVSIILTSFNHAKYLREAIDSALNQTFTDFELIIWDDASVDESWEIIQSYQDVRIKAFRNAEQMRGVYGINKAISEVATGEYIAIHHSDDVWELNKLEKQIEFLNSHEDMGAVFTNTLTIHEQGLPFCDQSHPYYSIFYQENRSRHQWLRHFFEKGNALCHPSVLIRKKCFRDCGLYRYGLGQLGDFDMWIRLCLKYEIHILPEKLVRFRIRENETNASGNRPETRSRSHFESYLLLANYLKIDHADDLFLVFPEAKQHFHVDHSYLHYAIAMAMLEIKPFYFSIQFALQILFEQINYSVPDKTTVKNIHNFIKMSGELDPFQVNKLEDLLQTISERDVQIAAIYQSKSWQLSKPLRMLSNLLTRIK